MRPIAVALLVAVALPAPARAAEPDFAKIFAGRDACFELWDMTLRKWAARWNEKRCGKRTSPMSTFKVPLALMAFDAGLLRDDESSLKWDGVKRDRESWNRDQTARSWMQESVVWFSQRLTPRLGATRLCGYLERFGYGNADVSGGVTTFWLNSSLLVSPDEQVAFWERFWRGELPVSKRAVEMTKAITLVGEWDGWTIHGKTGSSRTLGWFVGHATRGTRELLFVTAFDGGTIDRPPGYIARDLTKEILAARLNPSPP